ncbi:heterokaryon incompatibility protein-domain-containing protein [Colletotrichum godetiae]|uniref:Heterokaryon incompatibility protein-domain-containing protein n=1 Tax=Colletotrichum godetiae TaxID=1209918 RepID=A0AAJ0AIU5_9PEZI|nr:heterokaryon incompatibility protein-domain-containing protein [Colletotrichum godetiae]KAK1673243.1 heterokaryon incompatibility protein-domain-containing protein [Colletotrichum godetiae]
MICACCRFVLGTQQDYGLITGNRGWKDPEEPHHRDCKSLTASVDAGCYICNRLWAALDMDARQDIRQLSAESTKRESTEETEPPLTSGFLTNGAQFAYPSAYILHVALDYSKASPVKKSPPKGFARAEILLLPQEFYASQHKVGSHSRSTRSDYTFLVAQRWISECLAEHSNCGAKPHLTTTAQWYPTRLLDTGPLEEESSGCRLTLPNITPVKGPYATLSHCWGVAKSFSLTTDNYTQLLQDIPLDTLPQLYQDAIEATRRLNLRYLWIDSLCIIQQGDKFVDWRKESADMNKIYSGSFVNISAADAPDANHPLFHGRNPDAFCSHTIDLPVDSKDTRFLVQDYGFWRTEVSNAVINTRAWVLQERLLSPRVLYFGQRQILWECQQKEDAEIYPEGLLIDLSRFPSRIKGFGNSLVGWRPRDHGQVSKYHYWCNIVKAYTRAKLTFPGDKLVALSAVAKTVRELLEDRYVAGMWRRYLERELLWTVVPNEAQARPSAYRAPSWSWAAVDGQITPAIMDPEAVEVLIEVQDLHLDYVTSDTTGLISAGWLRLWGVLKKVELLPDATLGIHGNIHRSLMMVVNDVPVSVRADSAMMEYQPHVYFDDSQEWASIQNHRPKLFCVPAGRRTGNDGSIYVLLLQLQDRKEGIFRRIGIARGWGKELRESLLVRNAKERTLPCVKYEEGRHLVQIV